MPAGYKLSDEEIKFVQNNYKEMGPRKISKIIGCHETTVWGHARKLGLTGSQKKSAHRFTNAQCEFINKACKNKKVNLKQVCKMFNEEFGLSLNYQLFNNARYKAIREGLIKTRYEKNHGKADNSFTRELEAQSKQIKYRMTGGCHMCGAPADGKYCTKHLRAGFPRDMSSPRATEVFAGRF